MYITPKKIAKKISKNNKDYLSIVDAKENKFSCWFPQLFSYFMEGVAVDVITESSGDFVNIVAINQNQPVGSTTKFEVKKPVSEDEKWEEIRKEKSEGLAKGASFNKAVDVVIAIYQKESIIKAEDIIPMVKKVFAELKTINQNGND